MRKSNVKTSQRRLKSHLKNVKRKRKRNALLAFNDMVRPFKLKQQFEEWQRQQEEAAKAAEEQKEEEKAE